MSTATVYGPIADRVGAAVTTQRVQGTSSIEIRRFHSAPSFRYRRAQIRADVHVDHRGNRLGQLEHLEMVSDGQLVAFATINTDDVDLTDGPWFWSPTVRYDDVVVDLLELSLTRSPATVGLRPVKVLDGDPRHRHVQHRWRTQAPSSWVREMFERAGESAKADGPLTIYTRDDAARAVERSRSYDPQLDPNYGAGRRLEHSQHYGRVISVR